MKNKESVLLEKVLVSINKHLKDAQFEVATICEEVGLSERQLQRKLKSITGKTHSQLIRSARLQCAKEMLCENPYTIADIALPTGIIVLLISLSTSNNNLALILSILKT